MQYRSNKSIAVQIRNRKILTFLGFTLLALFVIALKLFHLQIINGDYFFRRSELNFLRKETILSQRGNVVDCNGVLLATNRPVFDLYWYGGGLYRLSQRHSEIIKNLKEILGDDIIDEGKIYRAERYANQCLIKKDVNYQDLCKISEQCSDCANVFINKHFKRIYPYGSLCSHILGYMRKAESENLFEGCYGLENIFQKELKGERGYACNVINASGKKILVKEFKDSISGSDIKLTINANFQNALEAFFQKGQKGVAVVMDPEDGAVKAMVSYPNFDPNDFLGSISEKDWTEKFETFNPLLNRSIHAVYPPASIFKMITFAAGLEEGVVKRDTKFNCKGHTLFGKRKYNCNRRWGHGTKSVKELLSFSCNIPCYEVAQKISIDQLAAYAMRFGLGSDTGFLFKDKSGLVPTSYWKQAYKGEQWWQGETLSASIGQSFLLVTPLQIVRMIASICSGQLVKPRIMCSEEIEKYPLFISEETLEFLRDVMKEVVDKGTARVLNKFKDFSIHAKTGTAQIIGLEKQKKEKSSQLEHAWFGSYFSYKNQKPLALVILVENAGSSRPALAIADKFFSVYGKLL